MSAVSDAQLEAEAPGGRSVRGLRASRARRASGGAKALIVRRLLIAIPVLWGTTFLTFIILNALPGDAAEAILGDSSTTQAIKALTIKLHLNEPFFERYWHWLSSAVSGNLGASLISGQSVASEIGQRFPVTLELVVYAFVISLVLAVPLAVIAAARPGGVVDRATLTMSMTGLSIAPYVLAFLLVYVFAVRLHVFPAEGWVSISQGIGGNLRYLTLPAFSIGGPLACFYTRLLRSDLVTQLESEEYVVALRAKGIGRWRVLTFHALRNSMFGLVTVVGLNIGVLIGATVIIEEIFGLPGIGQELYLAVADRDVPTIEGIVLVFAVVVVLANLAADLLYGVLDPRIRHGRATV